MQFRYITSTAGRMEINKIYEEDESMVSCYLLIKEQCAKSAHC